jgi:hypothetical protein
MKKTKFERRVNDPVGAFFSAEEDKSDAGPLSFAGESSVLRQEAAHDPDEKGDAFVRILRRIFLFLPGALFLYFVSTFFLYAYFVTKLDMFGFGSGLIGLAVSSFMTVYGLGSIKDFKNLAIPASICGCSFLVFMFSLLLPSEAARVKFLFEYSVYFFPVVLITAFSVKRLVGETGVEKECSSS